MTDFRALCIELADMLAEYVSLPDDPKAVALLRHARAALDGADQPHAYPSPMTFSVEIGPWLVGPFPTHVAALHWAESHGVDNWRLREMDDPAEAPGKLHRMRMTELKHPMKD